MINKPSFYLSALCSIMLCVLSCSNYHQDKQKAASLPIRAFDIFSDFSFMGSGPAKFRDNGFVDTTFIADHKEFEQAFPPNLIKGEQYVFYRRSSPYTDIAELAVRILPERLTRLGFKILTPEKSILTMFLYSGGPLFTIQFADETNEYTIYNKLYKTGNDASWDGHAYVLVRTR